MMSAEELGKLLERLNQGITLLWVTNIAVFSIIVVVLALMTWGAYQKLKREDGPVKEIKSVMNVLGKDDTSPIQRRK